MSSPLAFRLGPNRLHLGEATGRGYRAVCGRTIQCSDDDFDLVLYVGRQVGRAWRLEIVCLDCDRRVRAALTRRRLPGVQPRRRRAAGHRGPERAA